jgi:DNA (cytosine-5)-methyltransferase 1
MTQEAIHATKRLLKITAGNLKNSHIYLRQHLDFFPPDCVGPARRSAKKGTKDIELVLDGLNKVIETDICTDSKTGKARFFRRRDWVREFFKHHQVAAGDFLSLERLNGRRYRLSFAPEKPAFTFAEFFAGIGLVRLGLEAAGGKAVFANDIDPDKVEMYRRNWPEDDHLVVGDIHDIAAADVPVCDLFTASFPCNDLSIAGRWEGLSGKESSAFWGLIRILRELGKRRPPFVLLENVLGFLMSHGGKDFEQALLALNELGYVVDALIINAVHWAPQSRVRMFVVAEIDSGQTRQTAAFISDARPAAMIDFINGHDNIRWNLRDLPPLPKPTKQLKDIVEDLPDNDVHWWNHERTEYLFNQMSERHAKEAQRMIEGRSYTYATAFRRVRNGKSMAELRTDGIAGCLRTPRGGSGRQILFKAGRGRFQVRLLTARECARLQGVPESYVIDVPLNQALFGFGDASLP